ncbi:MAG TPA: type I phosphomannose isomerase catalytic subunit [Terriglobia bacterium]|nr:type I phosphomannose isomerase catalytic subunit [Terriglobia bacterium]
MPKLDTPLKLSPVYKPKIWGRDDLSPIFSWPDPASGFDPGPTAPPQTTEYCLIGEVWITDETSKILNGPIAGMTLGEASAKLRSELNGSGWKDRRFPILSKYIFTGDWLSLQVHPDDRYAQKHEPGNRGKCEMWYIVHAEPEAEILLGLKPGVTLDMLRDACEHGTSKDLLNRFHPKAGEAIFVPPGTVHALGPGLVLFEAEENSDITYRLDDFGRLGLDGKPRPLHLDKGFDVIDPDLPALRNLPRRTVRETFGSRRYVLACPHFAVEELTLQKPARFSGTPQRVETLSILSGHGRVETASGWLGYQAGDAWVIPPESRHYRLAPVEKTRILKFYVPDIERDFRRPLARRGFKAAQVKNIIFE